MNITKIFLLGVLIFSIMNCLVILGVLPVELSRYSTIAILIFSMTIGKDLGKDRAKYKNNKKKFFVEVSLLLFWGITLFISTFGK